MHHVNEMLRYSGQSFAFPSSTVASLGEGFDQTEIENSELLEAAERGVQWGPV